ncbi:MAG: hypothetical protein RIR88_245, partial [Actinomycetota bacterium]
MTTRTFAPQHTAGKVALWISVIGFASWIVL